MSVLEKLSNRQLSEIADDIDATNSICYINSETGEVIIMMSNEMLNEYGISWEDYDEEEDEETSNDTSYDWQDDVCSQIKADMAKIDSWEYKHTIRIEKPDSHEKFEIMENFVDEIIPEGKLKQDFMRALSRSHPFHNFNAIVHNCKYREDWFQFKQKSLENYVRKQIESHE